VSGLSSKPEKCQVNTLIYSIDDKADGILIFCELIDGGARNTVQWKKDLTDTLSTSQLLLDESYEEWQVAPDFRYVMIPKLQH